MQNTALQKRWFPLVSCMACLFLFNLIQSQAPLGVSAKSKEEIVSPKLANRTAQRMISYHPNQDLAPAGSNPAVYLSNVGTDVPDLFRSILPSLDPEDLTARMVSAPGLFSFPVVQQPPDQEIFVTNKNDTVTQFRMPSYDGVTGLIAHNYLSGQAFYKLAVGQKFWVLYEDNQLHQYRVSQINRYQKLNPPDPRSRLIDLSNNEEVSATQVYDQFYKGEHHVTFQTCLEGQGRLDWGLYFVVGEPDQP